jgi:hypothetical protein
MNIYAIEVLLQGTLHIKATSQAQADRILEKVRSNTIDGEDEDWYSDVPSPYRSRASFSTEFAVRGPIEGSKLIEVPSHSMIGAHQHWAYRWKGLREPYAALSKGHEQVPVFSSRVDLTATVFIQAETSTLAKQVVDSFYEAKLDLLSGNSRWFSKQAMNFDKEASSPVVLSSALYILGKSIGCELTQVWPDHPYQGPEIITIADEYL